MNDGVEGPASVVLRKERPVFRRVNVEIKK